MLTAIKSEFRKLLTVRSTYFVTGAVLLLVVFFNGFVLGYKEAMQKATSPFFVNDALFTAIGIFVTFCAILSILLVAHEYRYNTILYSFTLGRSRLKVLLAKVFVMLSYATVVGAVVLALGYGSLLLGLSLQGESMVAQNFDWIDMSLRYLLYVWGYALVGLVLALLIRGLVGAIVAFFVIPTIEEILSPLLKESAKYLPFRSLDSVPIVQDPGSFIAASTGQTLSTPAAIGLFGVYILVSGSIAAVLFLRRDAN